MKQLLKELKSHKKESILAPLLKMLEALMDLLVPLFMKKIMDVGIPAKDGGYITKICFLLVLFAILGLLFSVVAQYYAASCATSVSAGLRHRLFKKIQSLEFKELDERGATTLVTRMTSDVDQVQNGVNLALRLLLRSPFIVFGAVIMALIIDSKAAIVFLIVVPILIIVAFVVMLLTLPKYKKVQEKLDVVTGKTRENLSGVRVVRAFRREKDESMEFMASHSTLRNLQENVGFWSQLLNPITFVILNIATIVLIYVGAVRVDTAIITQGAVVALVNYMAQILTELVKFCNLVIQMTKAGASMNRIQEILGDESKKAKKEKPESATIEKEKETSLETAKRRNFSRIDEEDDFDFNDFSEDEPKEEVVVQETVSDENPPAIRFRDVSFSYPGAKEETLSNVSFEIGRGESVGIIGGTGSGKTSLVSLIPGYYETTEGTVEVFGRKTTEISSKALRKHITTVLQKAVIFSGTVRENLVFGLSEQEESQVTDDVLWFVLKMADAKDFVAEKGGLDARCEQGGRNFSGGQRQRLAIARALLRKPDILILDDSSSALDFKTDATIRRNMRAMGQDMTMLTVSQRASVVRAADRILVLDGGKLVGNGTHEELMENCAVYREIVESQQ